MSSVDRARQMQEQFEELQNQVEQPKKVTKAAENFPARLPESSNAAKIFIKKINVTGITVFPVNKINAITAKFENQTLTFNEIQKIADRITGLYRQKGYVTSRAYLPPQQINQGVLEIKVIEAKVGDIKIQGNRYFSSRLIDSYITLKKGDVFNGADLSRDLQDINSHPDRNVKSVLAPGSLPGSTDIILNVKDSLPMHVGIGYDNYLSYYLRQNELTHNFTDNNLSGRDDILNVQYNHAFTHGYYYYSGSYLYPVDQKLDMGVFYSRSNELLGRGLSSADSSGESKMYSFFGDQKLIKKDNLDLDLTLGFDYKNVDNYLQGALSSRDNLRIPRAGFNFDVADDFGRTVISDEADYGYLANRDIPASREGADSKFFLDTLNLLRLQKLPWDSTLLWKNQFQFSPSILTSTEQFQAGGPSNNRGFELADTVGDQGYAMNWELAVPPYFIPRYYSIPYFKSSLYDSLRFIGFYDWTNVHLNSLQPGEDKNSTLKSVGCGARLNVAQYLSASYEIAWPLEGEPADGKRVHQWITVTVTF